MKCFVGQFRRRLGTWLLRPWIRTVYAMAELDAMSPRDAILLITDDHVSDRNRGDYSVPNKQLGRKI
jgi:hypothetical protein